MRILFRILPSWIICILFIILSIILAWCLFKLSRKLFKQDMLEEYKDITAMYANIIGVLYGILLASIVIIIWGHFKQTKDNVETEANALGNIYRDSQTLEESKMHEIDSLIKVYVNNVINVEWNLMQ